MGACGAALARAAPVAKAPERLRRGACGRGAYGARLCAGAGASTRDTDASTQDANARPDIPAVSTEVDASVGDAKVKAGGDGRLRVMQSSLDSSEALDWQQWGGHLGDPCDLKAKLKLLRLQTPDLALFHEGRLSVP